MPFRLRVSTWIVGCGLLVPVVAAGQDRTARELVDVIVRDGPQARAIRAERDVTQREQAARLAYPNPAVSYSREGAGFTEFVQAEQPLPVFGLRTLLARAGVAATAAVDAEADVRVWHLRATATAAAARVVAEQSRLDAVRAHIRDVDRLIDTLRTREREGEGSRFDRLRAEQELRDIRLTGVAMSASLLDAKTTLAAMLPAGVTLGSITADDEPGALSISGDALVARAASTRAELRALGHAAARARIEADAARRARLPAPSLFAGMKRADAAENRVTGGVFGLSLSVPLFDSGRQEAARWDAEAVRVLAERGAIEQRIRAEILGAVELVTLRQDALADHRADTADELARIADVAYREGEVGILELLDSVRTAYRARTRVIDLRLEARLAQIALEEAVGEALWP